MPHLSMPLIRTIAVRNPAAGANLTITAPGDGGWRIMCLALTFATDATVASREFRLLADDGTTTFFATFADEVQVASLSWLHSVVSGAPYGGALTGAILLPWPTDGLWLPPGHRLRTDITNLQSGDQISAVGMMVEEFPTTADEQWRPSVTSIEIVKER